MSLQNLFKRHEINGKSIFVVDDHHKVLAAWALERRRLGQAPNLITIDYHHDDSEAFWVRAQELVEEDESLDVEVVRKSLVDQIDWNSDESLAEAIAHLRYDEHIHAATQSGVLNAAFSIQLQDGDGYQSIEQETYERQRWENSKAGLPPSAEPVTLTYKPSPERIYVVPYKCAIGCDKLVYDEECVSHHSLEIIESRYLADQLARAAKIGGDVGVPDVEAQPYILDIDLDAFRYRKAVNPDDPATFYRLIQNASIITIATEEKCVKELWRDHDDRMTSDQLLADVLRHIAIALI
jgi:hypothetical protein